MITVDHTFKITYRVFSDGAEVYVYAHDQADQEAGDDMYKVCEVEAAEAKNAVDGDIRV